MKILFMGTPTFASAALCAIAQSNLGAGLCGVVTNPDTPQNRGHRLSPSAVKTEAQRLGIPVYQPKTLKDGAFLPELEQISPDVIVVAAYGKILPEYVLKAPRFGCINIHGSLLPKYRGAAPIQRAIMNGERELGVTIMKMDDGVDTGDMLMRRSLVFSDEPFGEIYEKLARLGGDMIIEALKKLESGKISPERQNENEATYAPKIEKRDCIIDFSRAAVDIANQIRALSPSPCAVTTVNGKAVKITKAVAVGDGESGEDGRVISASPKGAGYFDISTGEGALRVFSLIPEGKKEMSAGDFLRGRGVSVGDVFGVSSKE